jgi:hypothetical protein
MKNQFGIEQDPKQMDAKQLKSIFVTCNALPSVKEDPKVMSIYLEVCKQIMLREDAILIPIQDSILKVLF